MFSRTLVPKSRTAQKIYFYKSPAHVVDVFCPDIRLNLKNRRIATSELFIKNASRIIV
jgi:hypothetical protein